MQELENNDSQTQTDESTMQQTSETPVVTDTAPTDASVADDTEAEGRSSRTLKLNRSSSEADSSETAAESESVAAAEAATESGADDGNGENGGGRGRRGRQRRGRREPHVPSENPLSLTELKTKSYESNIK